MAKVARLMASMLRDPKHAEGVLQYYNEIVNLHNNASAAKAEEKASLAKKAAEQEASKPVTIDSLLRKGE